MKHFLLFYQGGPDYLERRSAYRADHLTYAWEAADRGELLAGGAYADPVDGAVLMFVGDDKSVAEKFAEADPYVTNGLISSWHVREWSTAVGEFAANPVFPADV